MRSTKQRNFIGKNAKITGSNNKEIIGKKGTVIDETKNTITINIQGKEKRFIKKDITINIENTEIKGTRLNKSPAERIKVHHK